MVFFRHRSRERHLRYRVVTIERENQQIRAQMEEQARLEREEAQVRAARRAYMEKLRKRRDMDRREGGPK